MDLYNAKLNLDAIEIKFRMPQCYTEAVGLWDEPAAMKVILQKISQINETVTNPQVLLDRDALKHRPLLEKWNNTNEGRLK